MAEIVSYDDTQYAYDMVERICAQVGPGLPSSPQERKRAAVFQKELESHLGSENVAVEEFPFAPEAFISSPRLGAVFILLAALLNISLGRFPGISPWATAIPALLFSIAPSLLMVTEFLLGLELIDPLFKKKTSINVIGRLRQPGTKNVKRLLIVSGHHDSAWENTWLRFLGYGFLPYSVIGLGAPIVLFGMAILQLAGVISGSAGLARAGTLGWVLLVFLIVPSVIYGWFFTRGWENGGNVPGAVDNLSASAVAVAMCRFLVNHPDYIPEDVEIRFISFGAEEAGCRGSRQYVKRHIDELKRLDTRMLNFETIGCPEMTIVTPDGNEGVINSSEIINSAVNAARRAGVPFQVKRPPFGNGVDAVAFSKAGLKAVDLIPMQLPQQMIAFYHQKWDTPEMVNQEALLNALKLTFEWIRCGGA